MLLLWALGAFQACAQGSTFQSGPIQVSNVRSAPTPPGAAVGAVYLTITNHGKSSESLIALESPVAAKVELHRTALQQGMMQMREISDLECPAGATVAAAPGALHIMLLGLKQPLAAGSSFPLSLRFRDAGVLTVQVSVM